MKQDIHDYSEIYEIQRPDLRHHKRMPMEKRAAQFMPFSALDGYEDSIQEEERQIEERKVMVEEEKDLIRSILTELSEKKKAQISILYFEKDAKKAGGYYKTYKGNFRRIDEESKAVIFDDGTKIAFDDIDDIKTNEEDKSY